MTATEPEFAIPHRRRGRLRRDGPPILSKQLLAVVVVSFILVLGNSLVVPTLPLYAREFGVSAAAVGFTVSGYALGRLAFSPISGLVADRVGMRYVMSAGATAVGLLSLVAGTTDSFGVLAAARVGQGVGSAFYVTPGLALAVALAPSGRTGRAASLFQGALMTAFAAGPTFGGLIGAAFGLRAPFFVFAGLALAGAAVSLVIVPVRLTPRTTAPSGAPDRVSARDSVRSAIRTMRSGSVAVALLGGLVVYTARSGIRNTAMPLFAHDRLGLDEGEIGFILTVGMITGVLALPHAGRSIDASSRDAIMWSTLAAAAVAAGFAFVSSSWALLVASAALGWVTSYSAIAPVAVVAEAADEAVRSTAISVARMSSDLGLLVGPVLVGALSDWIDYGPTFLVVSAVLAAVAAAAWRIREAAPDPAPLPSN